MKTMKEQTIDQILKQMKTGGVSVSDLIEAQENAKAKKMQAFDLLIIENGVKKRVPFEEGKNCVVKLGIFPRKDNQNYIELVESDPVSCPLELDERRKLLTENFAGIISDVREELNAKLREIGAPEVKGDYWGYAHEWSGCGYWMARFDRRSDLDFSYYDDKHVAKVRKTGRF